MISIEKNSLIGFLVASALLMNAFLACVNANLTSISSTSVTIVQLIISFLTVITSIAYRNILSEKLLLKVMILIALIAIVVPFKNSLDIKNVYGILILPFFMMLGLTYSGEDRKLCERILYVAFFICLMEVILPNVYVWLFNPFDYYISTRSWAANSSSITTFYGTQGADFFAGSYRPGGTMLGFDTRAGSIFLEPISAGFFGYLMFLYLYYRSGYDISKIKIESVMCLSICVLSDTRLSIFLIFLTIFFRLVSKSISSFMVIIFPLLSLVLSLIIYLIFFSGEINEISYRIGITYEPILTSKFFDLIIGEFQLGSTLAGGIGGDSGLIKLIAGAGMFGGLYFIYLITGIFTGLNFDKTYALTLSIFIVIALLFSVVIFSIKIASIMGFCCGLMLQNAEKEAGNYVK